jgi:uncharacterized protein (TIGR00251 family)
MIECSNKDGKLTFKVQVVARASRSEVVGEHNGALRVRIAAPPVDGAANDELVRVLARAFKVSRSAVQITAGHTGKIKQVTINSVAEDVLVALRRASNSATDKQTREG